MIAAPFRVRALLVVAAGLAETLRLLHLGGRSVQAPAVTA